MGRIELLLSRLWADLKGDLASWPNQLLHFYPETIFRGRIRIENERQKPCYIFGFSLYSQRKSYVSTGYLMVCLSESLAMMFATYHALFIKVSIGIDGL
jgi:hypothetical protein